jgi:hypothetical protein
MRYRPPRIAQLQHDRLTEAGLVNLVRTILVDNRHTRNVTDLLCWVVLESTGGEMTYKIVAQFRRHLLDVYGQPVTTPVLAEAEFVVAPGHPFGLNDSTPLSAARVSRVRAIARLGLGLSKEP